MQHRIKALTILALVLGMTHAYAQEGTSTDTDHYQMNTLFKGGRKASGGYGAITNKFTNINGKFANLAGVYGGWYVNHSLLLGVGAAAVTNSIPVPLEHRTDPTIDLDYMYGQVGLMTEYVVASNKTFHVAFSLFSGAGFTLQYDRHSWEEDDHEFDWETPEDEDWFFVAEPGVMLEINVFKWMRFSPGVSYRATFGSDGRGLGDNALSDLSYNATLKFGRF